MLCEKPASFVKEPNLRMSCDIETYKPDVFEQAKCRCNRGTLAAKLGDTVEERYIKREQL